MAAPVNDDFASAEVVTLDDAGAYTSAPIPSTEATSETGEPVLGTTGGHRSVWFSITPEFSGTLTVDTRRSVPLVDVVDTRIGLYTGASVGALTLLDENDDSPNVDTGELWSELVDVALTAGVTYHLQVGLASDTATDVEYVVAFAGTGLFAVGADLTFVNDGYDYTGTSENLTDPPLATPPAGLSAPVIGRVHHALPAPTLDADGQPVGWVPVETIGPDWGSIRITVDGVDVTWFRDVTTILGDTQETDPYGPNNATLVFPRISFLDAQVPSPEIPWLREGARIRVDRVLDDEIVDRDDPPFRGIVDAIEQGPVTQITCSGWFSGRAATISHQPRISNPGRQDAAEIVRRHLRGNRHWDLYTPAAGTGNPMQRLGSRDMTLLGAVDDVLALMVTEDGDSWTLMPDPAKSGKAMRLKKRSMATVAYTVHAGAHGVQVQPRSDRVDKVHRAYAEAVTPDGERIRNAKYPNLGRTEPPPFPHSSPLVLGMTNADTDSGSGITELTREMWGNGDLAVDEIESRWGVFTDEVEDAVKDYQRDLNLARTGEVNETLWNHIFASGFPQQSFRQAHFEPFAYDPAVMRYLRAPDGTLVGFNPEWDKDVEHNDLFVGAGDHVTRRQLKKYLRGVIKRQAATNFTVVLTSDPEECSRLDIRPGKVLNVKHLFGSGLDGVDLYVSSKQTAWSDPRLPVTLACSTSARHYLDLATIKARRMEARRDPAAQWRHQLRRSNTVSDAIQGWEGESGAGIVRATKLRGGRYNVFPMVAAQLGTIGEWRLQTDPATRFIFMLFAARVSEKVLMKRLGNPHHWIGADENRITTFQDNADWLVDDQRLMVEAWGDPDQPCGLGRKPAMRDGEETTHPVTGKFADDGTWTFATRNGFLWVAVWPLADTTIRGRARIQLTEGV